MVSVGVITWDKVITAQLRANDYMPVLSTIWHLRYRALHVTPSPNISNIEHFTRRPNIESIIIIVEK